MTNIHKMELRSATAKRKAEEQSTTTAPELDARLYLHGTEDDDDSDLHTQADEDESDEDAALRTTPPPTEVPGTPVDLASIFPPSPYGRSREPRIYGDRFIPLRDPNLVHDYNLHEPPSLRNPRHPSTQTEEEAARDLHERRMFHYIRSEFLHAPDTYQNFMESEADLGTNHLRTPRRIYHYASPRPERRQTSHLARPSIESFHTRLTNHHSPESRLTNPSPISDNGLKIMNALQRPTRYVNRTAIKILDAPDLQDDFYLNLVDWGSEDCLAVGLGTCVYLWDANTSRVTKLCDLMDEDKAGNSSTSNASTLATPEQVTSVCWTPESKHLAVGTSHARLLLWDVNERRKVRTWNNHSARIGSLAINGNIFTSASRDHHIIHQDVRAREPYFRNMNVHTQEVCGLKWSSDGTMLASGGNDNKLIVWNSHENLVMHSLHAHTAAVKAIAWSPHDRSSLVSGGGTADKTIKFWNASRGILVDSYDTGSQVCNIAWSKRSHEIVSTHGFANQHVSSSNQVIVWNAKTMHRVATLTGHTSRVLFMSMDNKGSTIVTGAGDETLRFWDVFATAEPLKKEVNKIITLR